MTTRKTLLLVDAGNSYIKWRLEMPDVAPMSGRQPHDRGNDWLQLSRHWYSLPKPDRVLVSNVAGSELADKLKKLSLSCWRIVPEFAVITSPSNGISSSYKQPEKLGVDRWLAMISAHRQISGPLLIADCGTAVALDLIDGNGQQLDGVILPGRHIMRSCLIQRTKISAAMDDHSTALAEDTERAIARGSLLAIRASISRMQENGHQKLAVNPLLVLTGGDAEEVAKELWIPFQIMPELVLDGLLVHLGSGLSSL